MPRRTRRPLAATVALPVGLVLAGAAWVAPASSAAGAPTRAVDSSCPVEDADASQAPGDLDNDGQSDLVVGAPQSQDRAGAIDVTLASGARQRIREGDLDPADVGIGREPAPTSGDQFGAAIALGLFLPNGHCASVAVGIPGESDGRGSVAIYAGSASGLTSNDARWLTGGEPGDRFGAAVVAGDGGLYVGAPGANQGAGAVYHYSPFAPGYVYRLDRIITQDTAGVPGTSEPGDQFGAALAMSPHGLFVGAPLEDVGKVRNAGSVTFLPSTVEMTAAAWTQDSAGVPGVAESGDHFGDSLAASGSYRAFGNEVLIGIPDEAKGATRYAGAVQLLKLNPADTVYRPEAYYDQESPGVPGASEWSDRFGAAVAFAWQVKCSERWDAAVGVPGENVGSVVDQGSVTLLPRGSCAATVLTTGAGALGGDQTNHARVGSALSFRAGSQFPDGEPDGVHDVLLIGAPGLGQVGPGEVVEASRLGTDTPAYTHVTDSGGLFAQERYGAALAR